MIEKEFEGTRSKSELITQFLQLPIRENTQFKAAVSNCNEAKTNIFSSNKNSFDQVEGTDLSNPLITQIDFFTKMFEKFIDAEKTLANEDMVNQEISIEKIKETIYKTYTKTIDNANQLKNEAKGRMKSILDLLIYIQMKKIEQKLEYFNEFERLLEFETNQLKTMETHIVQDRIKLAIRRIELQKQIEKLK